MTYQQLSIILVLFLLITSSCSKPKGVLFHHLEVWNPDSTAFFEYKSYSLGVTGGYQTIEVTGEEILRYDFAVLYGGWSDSHTIEILSSDLPISSNTDKIDLKVLVEKAEEYDDYRRKPYLIHLSK
jgi:hypothetical protein